jgi:26S proteasome regulatory subunit N10
VTQLALKHRRNKSQRQRIIVFTCSPIQDSEKDLVKLAKKMKKNNVSIDFIAFGDLESETKQKLEAFNENVKGGDGSHLAIIPPGPNLLSDSIITTPILNTNGEGGPALGPGAADGVDGGAGSNGFEFGFNPEADPELAMALRMSMEEEQNRLERQRKEREEKEGKSQLEGIPEEGQPLLDQNGEASGSGNKQPTVEDEKKEDDQDKMDTA